MPSTMFVDLSLAGQLTPMAPGPTIIAAIHDRTLHHLPVPADLTIGLEEGRVRGVFGKPA